MGFSDSEFDRPDRITLMLDSYPVPHHVQSPGVNTMLVMADLIRLMRLATPIAVDVESMYFVAEGWELIDPPPKSKCVHT